MAPKKPVLRISGRTVSQIQLANSLALVLENLTSPRVTRNGSSALDMVTAALRISIVDLGTAKLELELRNHVCGHYFRVLYQLLKFVYINIPERIKLRITGYPTMKKCTPILFVHFLVMTLHGCCRLIVIVRTLMIPIGCTSV